VQSGLEDLLAVVGLEVTTEGVMTDTHLESWRGGRDFQISEAATLKPLALNEPAYVPK